VRGTAGARTGNMRPARNGGKDTRPAPAHPPGAPCPRPGTAAARWRASGPARFPLTFDKTHRMLLSNVKGSDRGDLER